jgi:teichuronic acid exporter
MFGLLAVAEPLVLTLFGEVWRPSVPLLQILCLAGLVWPLHLINVNVLLAQGHSRLFFRIEVAKKVFGVVCALVAVSLGLEVLAWSQVVYGILCFAIHAHYTKRLLGYGLWAQVFDCVPWVSAGALMACGVWLLQFPLAISAPKLLIAQIVSGAILYLGFCLAWDGSLLREMMRMLVPGWKYTKA